MQSQATLSQSELMAKAEEILNTFFGYSEFRSGQRDIIKAVFENQDVLGVLPTGGGKSISYQIPALVFGGVSLVISPLISLMKDQVDGLRDLKIAATYINSSMDSFERSERMREIREGYFRIVYVSPERLENPSFLSLVRDLDISLVAVDEAHCVSQWGHDFRPSYLAIPRFIQALPQKPSLLALTATATPEVRGDILERLGMTEPHVVVRGFDRSNLRLMVKRTKKRRDEVLDFVRAHPNQPGIVYAATRKEVEKIHDLLQKNNISVGRYHAGLPLMERRQNQEDFLYDRIQVMVATNAFGMGIDKSNVRFVVHANMPKDPESYYQEAGRAGRDGDRAECLLLYNDADLRLQYYFIEQSEAEVSEEVNKTRRAKIKTMVDYAYTSDCLRHFLLDYFGEDDIPHNCGNCSNCDPREWVDITVDAQKILSCVYRVGFPVGSSSVAKILRGSKEKKIFDKKWNELSTYGILKELSVDSIRERIVWMIGEGFLKMNEGAVPTLSLTQEGFAWLKRRGSLSMPMSKVSQSVREKTAVRPKAIPDEDLFEILRKGRLEVAREEDIPPYRVFTDKTLREMSAIKPTNDEDFRSISGVGQYKLERYGLLFLKMIQNYIENGD